MKPYVGTKKSDDSVPKTNRPNTHSNTPPQLSILIHLNAGFEQILAAIVVQLPSEGEAC